MARRPAAFTQADVARAVRAAKQAGAAEVEVRASTGANLGLEAAAEIIL